MNFITTMLIIFLFVGIALGEDLFLQGDVEEYNNTLNLTISYNHTTLAGLPRATKILNTFGEFVYIVTLEVMKIGVEFGYAHPTLMGVNTLMLTALAIPLSYFLPEVLMLIAVIFYLLYLSVMWFWRSMRKRKEVDVYGE